MDAPKVPDTSPALAIAPANFEIVLADDADNPLSFVSPPINDISEMAELANECFSLRHATRTSGIFEASARQQLFDLEKKSKTLFDSPTFFNRLANLQRALGDLQSEASSLNQAFSLGPSPFLRRKIAESTLRSGDMEGARNAFAEMAMQDAHSALRTAYLSVLEGDLDGAERWVNHAVDLEPDGYAERLFQGGLLLHRGQLHQAIRIFWMAIGERPNSSVAYANLALAYLGTSNAKKAFTCLKRAVALDPLNRSAILAIADVAHLLERDTDAINSIRYFLQFEQREPAVWSRLARSLLKIGAIDECIDALKRQGAFERSTALWNNLGVAYARKQKKAQSLEAFNYALSMEGDGKSRAELVVARNIAQLISTIGKPDLLLSVTESIVSQDIDYSLAHDPELCDIYGFFISALMQNGRREEALELSEELLSDPALGAPLSNWLFQSLTGLYGLSRNHDDALTRILDNFLGSDLSEKSNVGLMNNVAFALIELDRLDEAEKCLKQAQQWLHKDAYLTATFGLINFRRGRAARGEMLYKEAISLARTPHDKSRIRQKMYLEIGRYSSPQDAQRARRALEKVLKEKKGEKVLIRQASLLLKEAAKPT